MKKIIILLSLLILLPLTATSNPLIPIMKTLFTDVTGTVPDAEEIAHKAELFRQQTGVAPFIVVLPDINNEASLRQNGKAMLAHAASSMSNVKG
ncbi:TPM domain-containing protein, partial [Escherichia coli]|nr:TPM domain-containing protein [Escherichia coli]